MHSRILTLPLLVVLVLAGCRGMESDEPPIHPNLNMDFQERFEAQEANAFFENEAAMRTPPPGTVPHGMLREDTRFYAGLTEDGALVEETPIPVTRELLERGQERYNIYCAVCHGRAGGGQGIIMTGGYGYTPAPSYHIERLREVPDGYLYDVITNGIRTMPAYAHQIPVADRWAIVAYVRALQRSQYATEEDVPPSVVARAEQERSTNVEGGRAGVAGAAGQEDTTGAAPSDTAGASVPAPAGEAAPADPDTAVTADQQQPAAAADTAEGAAADVAASDTAAAEGDTAAAPAAAEAAPEDTAAGAAAPADEAAPGGATGAETTAETADAGTTNGSGLLWILVFVVLPITAMVVMLIAAFRKEREH